MMALMSDNGGYAGLTGVIPVAGCASAVFSL